MDADLRVRVRSGEPAAFEILFDSYANAVFAHAMRLCGDRSLAEDVMATTFLEAWRLRERVDADGGSLRPWLLGIATNALRNHRRTRRRYEALLTRVSPPAPVADIAEEVAGRLDDTARLRAARHAIGRLRRAEQEVVALCVWSGLDYAAAAQALGVPIGTVRSRLSRARRRLAGELAENPAAASGQILDERTPDRQSEGSR
jgi:RNA polymerase sigma-70 factor (ECF subfamily)